MQIPSNGQHFRVLRPWSTHFRTAECREANCQHYLEGWRTIVPTVGDLADWIRHEGERSFTEAKVENGLSEFVFASGQRCFREHKLPLDKQEHYLFEAGAQRRVHQSPGDWTEHFNEERDKLDRVKQRG